MGVEFSNPPYVGTGCQLQSSHDILDHNYDHDLKGKLKLTIPPILSAKESSPGEGEGKREGGEEEGGEGEGRGSYLTLKLRNGTCNLVS